MQSIRIVQNINCVFQLKGQSYENFCIWFRFRREKSHVNNTAKFYIIIIIILHRINLRVRAVFCHNIREL